MFCPKCGMKNEEDCIFCTNCGFRINEAKYIKTAPNISFLNNYLFLGVNILLLIGEILTIFVFRTVFNALFPTTDTDILSLTNLLTGNSDFIKNSLFSLITLISAYICFAGLTAAGVIFTIKALLSKNSGDNLIYSCACTLSLTMVFLCSGYISVIPRIIKYGIDISLILKHCPLSELIFTFIGLSFLTITVISKNKTEKSLFQGGQ